MTITDELITHIAGEPHERQQRFAKNRDIYEGTMDAPLTGETARLDNVIVPAARNIVDAGVASLFGEAPTFDVSEAYGDGAQKALERFWRLNRMPTRLVELAMHGGITGQFVAKFEPDATNERDGNHRVVVVDPCYLDVAWDPHDTSQVLLYRFEYPTVDEDTGEPFVWRQDIRANRSQPDQYGRRVIESWTIQNWRAQAPKESGGKGVGRWFGFQATRQITRWDPVGREYRWPFKWAPVFAGQNLVSPNSWWGYSDIEGSVVRLINSLNRAVSNVAKTIRHFGHPVTVVRGGQLPDDHVIGEPIEFDENPSEIDVANLEMQSDLTAALEFLRELRGEVYDAADLPDVARGKLDKAGDLSGTAMRIMFGPQLAMTGKKRLTYGDELEALLRCVLEYMKFRPVEGADADVHLVWHDPLPKNEKEDAETGDIDRRHGLSKRTYLIRRGYDPDQEAENELEEGANDPGMRGVLDLVGAAAPTQSVAAPENGAQGAQQARSDRPASTDASVTEA